MRRKHHGRRQHGKRTNKTNSSAYSESSSIKNDNNTTTTTKREAKMFSSTYDPKYEEKVRCIYDSLAKSDMAQLAEHCITEGGLVSNTLRRVAWPRLLGIRNMDEELQKLNVQDCEITKHSQYEQVEKDVERSLWKYTTVLTDLERQYKRKQLSRILNSLLSPCFFSANDSENICTNLSNSSNSLDQELEINNQKTDTQFDDEHPQEDASRPSKLYYFQGFHDICSVFLLVCGESMSIPCIAKLSRYHLRDCLVDKLDPILEVLKLIHPLIRLVDPELASFLQQANMEESHFALSWVLTWFSHVVDDLHLVARLFDLFLASHPLIPMYLAASIVLYRRSEVMYTGGRKRKPEFSSAFSILNNFPAPEDLPLELLISRALELYYHYPPQMLQELSKIRLHPSSTYNQYPYTYLQNLNITNDIVQALVKSRLSSSLRSVSLSFPKKLILWSTVAVSISLSTLYFTMKFTDTSIS